MHVRQQPCVNQLMVGPGLRRVAHAFLAVLAVGPASAFPPGGTELTINNPGFEANPVATGCFAVFNPTGWTLYDPNGIVSGNNVIGGINCDTPYFPGGAPEGEHASIVFLGDTPGTGPMGLTQVLADVLEADTTYTLTAQIGNIASGQGPPPCDIFGFFNLDGFPGYQVQLLAGGVVIAQDDNSLDGSIPEGEFALSTVQVAIGASHPQLGQPLEVRLINLHHVGTPQVPGIEVDFDDVRLVAGCPATADLDNDLDMDAADAGIFVNVLLGLDADPQHVSRADADCSGVADAEDVQPFVALLLD